MGLSYIKKNTLIDAFSHGEECIHINAASFVKSSAGFLSTSGSICNRMKMIQLIRELEK